MKETLLKKRYGIPVALLLALVLCGTALAWYCFATISSETTEFSANMRPGESNTWTWEFDIVNSADMGHGIKVDLTFSAPNGVSITGFATNYSDLIDDLLDDNSATVGIPAGDTLSCSLTVKAAKDATPRDVLIRLRLSRE